MTRQDNHIVEANEKESEMKTSIIIFITAFTIVLSGCNKHRGEVEGINTGDINLDIYSVQGKPLECISLPYGKSCNWEKYNQIK